MADGLSKQGQLQLPCGQAAVQPLLHHVTRNISNAPGEHQPQVAQAPSPLVNLCLLLAGREVTGHRQ